jgi:GntR family negative regulator for fad regulon and positive regulator of fabA
MAGFKTGANMLKTHLNPPLRPTQFVEHFLVTSILNGTFAIGASLPNERLLSEQLGVTRPTLRETLQRLENEGWVQIRHGKPTVVNDFWQKGGLSLLSTLAKYVDDLPGGFIAHLLEVRVTLLPPVARMAVENHPEAIADHLADAANLQDNTEAYVAYDWRLQMLMARHSNNPIFPLILNDFGSVFKTMAQRYFSRENARKTSKRYYQRLSGEIRNGGEAVENIVRASMIESVEIWEQTPEDRGQGWMNVEFGMRNVECNSKNGAPDSNAECGMRNAEK